MKSVAEIADCIWSISSEEPGPTVAIVGGTHGNERTGCAVVQHLLETLVAGDVELRAGKLLLALGNPKAVEKNTRGSCDGADLNRCFTPVILAGEGHGYEPARARELAHVLRDVDVGIDIHATNKPSVPFVVSQPPPSALARSLISHLHADIILTDPDWIFAGGPATLDELFAAHGGIGLCYETGLAEDTSRVEEVTTEMLNILRTLGLIHGTPTLVASRGQTVYRLAERIMLTDSGFAFAAPFGSHNFQPVHAGDVIGHHGRLLHRTLHDGVIIFPKPASLWRVGEPVGYLAKRME